MLRTLSSARRALYKICLRCAHGDQAEADDLLAEASLRVVESGDPTEDEVVNPISWWATIIRNIARDRHRQRVCRRELTESLGISNSALEASTSAFDGLAHMLARWELKSTFETITRLPARQRTALLLRAVGAEYDEIANEVGATYDNTRKLVQVARRQLRQIHGEPSPIAS